MPRMDYRPKIISEVSEMQEVEGPLSTTQQASVLTESAIHHKEELHFSGLGLNL
jgi:hypothetical protein